MNFSVDVFYSESAALVLALFWVAILIDLVAGHLSATFVPSLNTPFTRMARFLIKRLDRPTRTHAALRTRGAILLFIILPSLFYLGMLANQLLGFGLYGYAIIVAVLVPLVAQKKGWQRLIQAGAALKTKKETVNGAKEAGKTDLLLEARLAASGVILNFCSKLVPLTAWWCIGGFACLLPYLMLSRLVTVAEKKRTGTPSSPFFALITPVYELMTAPFSIAAAALLALAHFFLPGTNLGVFTSFNPTATIGLASRYFPLNAASHGLGLSLEADVGEEINKMAAKKPSHWIGPKTGRAQLNPTMMRKVWLIILITFSLYMVVGAMIFTLLLPE